VDDQFAKKIERYAPRLLAFHGKRAASLALKVPGPTLGYGRQDRTIGETALFVLPSTSGAASGFWDARHWHAFAHHVRTTA
jgi:TDG/mug DNA glycosylase family protein